MDRTLLWIDEDLDEWWAVVDGLASTMSCEIVPKYTVEDALEYLEKNEPNGVLLDLITRTGQAEAGDERVEGRYSGLRILRLHPELVERTVIFTVVPRSSLEEWGEHLPQRWIGKIATDLVELNAALRSAMRVPDGE